MVDVITTNKYELALKNINVICRKSDGYINATQLCQAGDRKFNTYYRRKKTKEFLEVFSIETQNCVDSLINYNSAYGEERSTWVHPQIAINIAQWISAEFDVKVSKWIYELMLFGNVTLNSERSYEELEKKLKEQTMLAETLSNSLNSLTMEHKKLKKSHREILRHKSIHYFKKGKCVYLISNILEGETRAKIGSTWDINTRLKNLRTGIPFLRLHYLVFTEDYELIEKILKNHYKNELDPNNHEFISTDNISSIITKIRESMTLIKSDHTETPDDEMIKYNIDTNEEKVEPLSFDKIYIKPVEFSKENKSLDVCFTEIIGVTTTGIIKRCPGKCHELEEDRMLESSNFHKNKATKDGYATYCKKCASNDRYKNEDRLKKKEIHYDKKLFKWCAGISHINTADRVVNIDNFHKNASSKDCLSVYCKECTGQLKYGKDRKKRIVKYTQAPPNIPKDTHKWCTDCELILERKEFHSNKKAVDGLQNECINCRKNKRKY